MHGSYLKTFQKRLPEPLLAGFFITPKYKNTFLKQENKTGVTMWHPVDLL